MAQGMCFLQIEAVCNNTLRVLAEGAGSEWDGLIRSRRYRYITTTEPLPLPLAHQLNISEVHEEYCAMRGRRVFVSIYDDRRYDNPQAAAVA